RGRAMHVWRGHTAATKHHHDQDRPALVSRLPTRVRPSDPEFRANADHMEGLVERLRAARARAALGGPEEARRRHTARGKLLPRERIVRLLDPGTPFLELSPLAAHGCYDDEALGAGVVTGIGRIAGRECVLVANDATVKGGTYYPLTVKKHLRAQEIALENRLGCVYLVDSGGAVHTRISGVADHLAADDADALRIAREIFAALPAPHPAPLAREAVEEPAYDPRELYGIVARDPRKLTDARELVARLVDGSRFHEFKALYGPTLVTGFAHLHGYPVGILANQGVLFSESALKATHFIELACARRVPLVFLQN